jgi:hypothetical protein
MRAGGRTSFDPKTCRSRGRDRRPREPSSAARQPAQKPRSTLARRWQVIPTACPITIALPSSAAVETVVVPGITAVIAALATFVLPGVGRSACNPSGQGKTDHDNDSPFHVWPTAWPRVTPRNSHQETTRARASSAWFRRFLIGGQERHKDQSFKV